MKNTVQKNIRLLPAEVEMLQRLMARHGLTANRVVVEALHRLDTLSRANPTLYLGPPTFPLPAPLEDHVP